MVTDVIEHNGLTGVVVHAIIQFSLQGYETSDLIQGNEKNGKCLLVQKFEK
jgi:hypothetical protein